MGTCYYELLFLFPVAYIFLFIFISEYMLDIVNDML